MCSSEILFDNRNVVKLLYVASFFYVAHNQSQKTNFLPLL